LPQTFSSPTRRWILLGLMLAAGGLLFLILERRDGTAAAVSGGNFRTCSQLEGDAARACYKREVGRELAAIGSTSGQRAVFVAPSDGSVTFATAATADTSAALLCDLHIRAGNVDASTPSWVSWNEPPAS